jgi:tRNA(fMet)-specific endonuclease VapC
MKKIVLDTNAYSLLMKGDQAVAQALDQAEQIFLPLFVIAELLLGFKKGSKLAENRAILARFEAEKTVNRYLPTAETAEIFSDLLLTLRQAGTPLPVHDIWIAAIAIETGSILVTYDQHFSKIPQVRRWDKLAR